MTDVQKREFKNVLKKFSELLKDPELQRKGKNGGIALWKKIKEKELKKKLAAIESILGN